MNEWRGVRRGRARVEPRGAFSERSRGAHEPRFLYVAADSDDALLVVQYRSDGTAVDGLASNGTGILIEALVYG